MIRFWPLGVFLVLLVLLYAGLYRDPREVPSPLIGKPAPAFRLSLVDDPAGALDQQQLKGHVYLLNVWASWCVSCREEHPLLVEFAKQHPVAIYGLDYKDQRPAAMAWLARFGNPYKAAVFDPEGRTGIDYGVYAVPETFVVDKKGTIRFKQIGPFTPEILSNTLLPLLTQLEAES